MNFDGGNVTRLTDDPATDMTPVWSPNGKKIAYSSGSFSDLKNSNIYVVDVDSKNINRVTNFNPNTIVWPSLWSLDGQSIFFEVYRQIVQVGLNGGDIRPITLQSDQDIPLNFVVSKDGSTFSYLTQCNENNGNFCNVLRSIQSDGTNAETLSTLKTPELCNIKQSSTWTGSYTKWSPDRTKILFFFSCEDSGWIYIANADGSEFKPLTNYPILGNGPDNEVATGDWSSDSQSIVFTSALDTPENFGLYTLNVTDALEEPSMRPELLGNLALASSPAWQPEMNNDIVEEESTQTDNRLIAFTSEKDGNAEIYTMRADGSNQTNLTNYSAHDVNPIWSPDGKRIAFESDRTGFIQIYTMNADGSNLVQITNEEANHAIGTKYGDTPEPWSSDGKKIIFSQTVRGDENSMLYVMDADGSNKIALTSEPGTYIFLGWSPDGQKIVYQTPNPGHNPESRIMIASVDGTGTFFDGPFFDGDAGRRHHQIHWETSEQFITVSSNSERPLWGLWNFTRFYTTEEGYTNSIGSNPILAYSDSPIVAIFDRIYVVENQDSLTWFVYEGAPIPFSPWKFSEICKTSTDPLLVETFHIISPDNQQDFVSLLCPEGATHFFLMNADGTEIHQLGESFAKPLQVNAMEWSPDGKFVIATILNINNESTELYRFDIQEMLNNSSTQPIQLTTDAASKYGVVWQPIVNDDIAEEEATQTDNRLIAFTSNQDGNLDIYTMRADGSGLTNLTNNPADDINPFWSPDGTRIAFESDRDGFMQIYLMNADGSDVIQLTDDETESELGMKYYSNSTSLAWSPDGNKLIFSQRVSGDEKSTPYVMDVDGNNKMPLVSEPGMYGSPSWSPDGKHIAFLSTDTQNPGLQRLYVVAANGNNLRDVTEMLPSNEGVGYYFKPYYHWSRDGQSIFFIASNAVSSCSTGTESNISESCEWKAYETHLDDNALITKATARTPMGGWWQGTYFIVPYGEGAYTWVRPDGSIMIMNPIKDCQRLYDSNTGGYFTGSSSHQQSSNGNVVVGAYCPNGDMSLFWVDSKGTVFTPLMNLHGLAASNDPGNFGWAPTDLAWSSDDKYIAFNIFSSDETDMYILNVSESQKDPSIQPVQISLGDGSVNYNLSWQPTPNNNIVEQKPTPEPTQTSSDNRLLAFTAAIENGNLDIYIMHSDGSELTNLTNNPAHDVNPIWSPDGKRIAFESDRTGLMQIFIMNADGSNLTQVTNNQAQHEFSVSDHSLWSPNGSSLLFTEWEPSNEKWMLYVIGVDGQNKTPLAEVPNSYTSPSWSPDGQHVAFILTELQENLLESRERNNIYVVNADGRNLTNITTSLPSDEQISWNYSWSNDAQSILFIADRYIHENGNGKSTLYKASLDGNTLTEIDHVGTHMADWWQGTSFIDARPSSQALMWLRPDGTNSTLDAFKNCAGSNTQSGPINYKRSSSGDLIIAAGCANDEWWLYWVNPNGTAIKQLLGDPLLSRGMMIFPALPGRQTINLLLSISLLQII